MKPTESLKQVVKIELTQAANHDFVESAPGSSEVQPTGGWDPMEVWRRMIQEPRQRRALETHDSC